ncbi:unnamed protein product [Phaeothamnion confervicola]
MLAELEAAQKTPPFSLEKPRYNLETFLGRTLHFYSVNDPRTLLITKEEIDEAGKVLERYRNGTLPKGVTDEQLWAARRTRESTLHPDTGEPIFPLFRFSAFVPVNMGIVTAMLAPAVISSFPATAAVHLVNQSYNAAINFANRNASNPTPTALLVQGYVGAVTTSIGIGMGATYMTKRAANMGPGVAGAIRATLPFLATAAAGSANIGLMRRSELVDGVDVYDHEGKNRGKSAIAGTTGIAKCAAARVLWNIPIMVVPPLIMMRLERTGPLARNPRLKMATEIAVVTACLIGAVSPALAAFPQRDRVEAAKLEPRLQHLTDSAGQPITELWYNKGL